MFNEIRQTKTFAINDSGKNSGNFTSTGNGDEQPEVVEIQDCSSQHLHLDQDYYSLAMFAFLSS